MQNHLETLESRTLLSASAVGAVTLADDRVAVAADANAVKGELNVLFTDDVASTKLIASDFKALPKADRVLLTDLLKAESKTKALFAKYSGKLASVAKTDAAHAEAIGISLLNNPTVKSLLTASKDIAAVQAVAGVPVEDLAFELSSSAVSDARTLIIDELGTSSVLGGDTAAAQAQATTDKAAVTTALNKLVTDLSILATDLTTVHTATGTFPSLMGEFDGTADFKSGKSKGDIDGIALFVLTEDSNGNITGTINDTTSGETDDFAGAVALNGKLVIKGISSTNVITVTGKDLNGVISGAFHGKHGAGTFSVAAVEP